MKKLTATIVAIAAIITINLARAERVNIGDCFSLNVPDSWETTPGSHVHHEGEYIVFKAHNSSYSCYVQVAVINPPEIGITFEDYVAFKEEDKAVWASVNRRVGWTLPTVRKTEINGIPVLLFKQTTDNNTLRFLSMELWTANKHFVVQFFYTAEGVDIANRVIDSFRAETPPTSARPEELIKALYTE
jgi:hypothetical protein